MKTSISHSARTLFGLILFPLLAVFLAEWLSDDWYWKHLPFHSFIETSGAVIALASAAIILWFANETDTDKIPFAVPAGLIAIGVLDGFHAAAEVEQGFVWLHSIATFFGGLLFMTVISEQLWRKQQIQRLALPFILLVSGMAGLLSVVFPHYLPSMISDDGFTRTSIFLNLVGGSGFVVGGFKLNQLSITHKSVNLRLFAYLSVLLGSAGLVFQLSVIWDATWWCWHILRFLAYMLSLTFIINQLRSSISDMRRYRDRLEMAAGVARIGIWDLDLSTFKMDCDERMYELYHIEKSDVTDDLDSWTRLLHPEDLEKAWSTINQAIEQNGKFESEFRILPPNGHEYFLKSFGKVIPGSNGQAERMVGTIWDITAHKSLESEIKNLALTDALTGLPNRNLLEDRLSQGIAHSDRSKEILTVCMMDLDGFKLVNDSLGHDAGDKLLIEVARRLVEALRPEDTVLRLGGDEFVLIVGGAKAELDAEKVVQRVLEVVAQPYSINRETVKVTASIGVTFFPRDNVSGSLLLRHADQAMYQAKAAGKNKFFLFDPLLESRHKENFNTIRRIEKALNNNQLELYYQPQVDCVTGEVVSVEALIRWNHPVLGVLSPGEFLPLVENDDIIIRIGDWVIETAVQQMVEWRKQGIDIDIGVNISSRHLLHGEINATLDGIVKKYSHELLKKLEFEFVETAALEDLKTISALNSEFQRRGIHVALDDFGTGFSSLTHLKHLSVNTLKIDRSFIRDMQSDPGDLAIIEGVIGLSRGFNCRVVAEGAETVEQIMILLGVGCSVIQGYGLCRPLPAAKCTDWIKRFNLNPLWNALKETYPSRLEFDLLVFEVIHRNWLKQVKEYCEQGTKGYLGQPDNYDNCRMTKWFSTGNLLHGKNKEDIAQLKIQHQNVHSKAEELIRQVESGSGSEAIEQKMQQLELASNDMYEMAEAIRSN